MADPVYDQWMRYTYCRDYGHTQYISKSRKCEDFFAGDQWSATDLRKLTASRRPALTINKIIATLANIFGEQIRSRAEVTFKPKSGSPAAAADVRTKVWKHIAENNQLQWIRDEVFADGSIGSRGFYDCRMDFEGNLAGDIRITAPNPRCVVIDADGADYDPDSWEDVFVTKWMSAEQIELLWGSDKAKELARRTPEMFEFGLDSVSMSRERFGGIGFSTTHYMNALPMRDIRILERQYRSLETVEVFVDPKSGEWRAIPEAWDYNRRVLAVQQHGLIPDTRRVMRVRWRTTADNIELEHHISDYEHFTIIPYFPFFRKGRTIGLVENLLGPQEYLNKVSSQELHIANTTANSGWKVKAGALTHMTIDELEERGAETGLVVEVNDMEGLEKILPNQVPTALDRISLKAEQNLDTISGRGPSMTGLARPDVAARAIQENKDSGQNTNGTPLSNLERSDWLLARQVMCLMHTYYTNPRVFSITTDEMTNAQETIHINSPNPDSESDELLLNDLTAGEYAVQVVSQPYRRTIEESQFQQGVGLRELGVQIPDEFLIKNSSLIGKTEMLAAMKAAAETPDAKLKAENEMLQIQLQTANLKADAQKAEADSVLKQAKAAKEDANTEKVRSEIGAEDPTLAIAQAKMEMEREAHDQKMRQDAEEHAMKMAQMREKARLDLAVQRAKAAQPKQTQPA